MTTPRFTPDFIATLDTLFTWRRDVRRFKRDTVHLTILDEILDIAQISPSVGNSQPWRFVSVESATARAAIRDNFNRANADALASYNEDDAAVYARLKLAGLDAAPVQLAVFTDTTTTQGKNLGRMTMPEMLDYSTVSCINALWLAARARGIGLGWVSILEVEKIPDILDVPAGWHFVAYLCLGWPEEEHEDPELIRNGWQNRTTAGRKLLVR